MNLSKNEPWSDLLTGSAPRDHIVQLYQDEQFLSRAVCRFAAGALANGEGVILVPTSAHWNAFRPRLEAEGVDIEACQSRGQLTIVDADGLLPRFLRNAMPEAPVFLGLAAEVIARARGAGAYPKVRWWGEMVNLLWERGDVAASMRLEELSDQLAEEHGIAIFCSFRMDNFSGEVHTRVLPSLGCTHSHLIPVEDYNRLERAVAAALHETVGPTDARVLEKMIFEHHPAPAIDMPRSQALLLALRQALPRLADTVLLRSRHLYDTLAEPSTDETGPVPNTKLEAPQWFTGGGEMSKFISSMDWSKHPLGPIESWSESLRTAVGLCLESRFPMIIWSGQELRQLYNDAFLPSFAGKHPAIGKPGRETWAEIWHIIGPQLESVLLTGQATWSYDLLLPINRSGFIEETYWTYSFSPIRSRTGEVEGVFTATHETTRRVLAERRLRTLRDLGRRPLQMKTVAQTYQTLMQSLSSNSSDIPFALLYVPNGNYEARLAASTAIVEGTPASPITVDLRRSAEGPANWPLAEVIERAEAVTVENLREHFGDLPGEPWPISVRQAVVLPVRSITHTRLAGWLIAGINPGRPLDHEYQRFFDLAADQMANSIEKAQADEALRQSEERLQAVLINAPITLFSLDREGNFTLLTGQCLPPNPNQAIGRSALELFCGLPNGVTAIQRALAGKSSTSSGEISGRWLEVHYAPLRDADGRVFEVTGVALDVTERKRAEEELMRASKLESIGVLAGGIAHDFNNILTAIIGNLALAKMALGPENKVIPRLVESEKVVLRAQSLSQQLLAFSKGGKPVKQVMSVGKLLKESVVFALQGSNVHSEFSIPDDLWPIEADQGQITQVVHNIVLNAQQAMPTGGNIQIKAANFVVGSGAGLHLAAGDYVKIRFNDQGTGISQENLAKIFDPFFTTKPKGSGLGLASAYWIIQRHHGYIAIDSKLGAGTTVSVYLPRSERETPAEEPAEEALITGQGRILFMDDEEAIREFASEVLSQLGYEVECAQNGLEAIELFRKARESRRHFAAAILDLTVRSGMGGKETGRRLREMDPGVKTIVSSGYSNDAVLADFREHGFSARMTKPYTAENLSRILAEVIKI